MLVWVWRMGRTRIGWALGVVAPWCLGMGVLVSITADAGQDFISGATLAPLEARAPTMPRDLIPRGPALSGDIGLYGAARGLLREARLNVGPPEEFRMAPEERAPRLALKPNARHFPEVVRAKRGDPNVGLRPSFDARMRRPGGLQAYIASDLMFRHDETSPAASFTPYDGESSGPETVEHFEPWAEGESPTTTTTVGGGAGSSPTQGGSVITMRPAAISARLAQGASPATARAVALGSATPAPADATPVEIVAVPSTPRAIAKGAPNTSMAVRSTARPDYASLIAQDNMGREKKCLAEAVYFEARSEPEEGQAAVAQVVLNRVSSGLYPSSVCGVVYQNRQRYKACQFSFACEGKSLRINDSESWRTAVEIANEVMDGRKYSADVGFSTHYHANYVKPRWAKRLRKMDVIGRHIFYQLKPGQT